MFIGKRVYIVGTDRKRKQSERVLFCGLIMKKIIRRVSSNQGELTNWMKIVEIQMINF